MQVVYINLDDRPDRREAFEATWRFIFPRMQRFAAFKPDAQPMPSWWSLDTRDSHGAWGACMSHRAVLGSIKATTLILEDDAAPVCPPMEFGPKLAHFMLALERDAPDWQLAYIGGELMQPRAYTPQRISADVLVGYDVNRMHAYIVKPLAAAKMFTHLQTEQQWNCREHCDHRIGQLHRIAAPRVYIPPKWLVQQGATKSSINEEVRFSASQFPDPENFLT